MGTYSIYCIASYKQYYSQPARAKTNKHGHGCVVCWVKILFTTALHPAVIKATRCMAKLPPIILTHIAPTQSLHTPINQHIQSVSCLTNTLALHPPMLSSDWLVMTSGGKTPVTQSKGFISRLASHKLHTFQRLIA